MIREVNFSALAYFVYFSGRGSNHGFHSQVIPVSSAYGNCCVVCKRISCNFMFSVVLCPSSHVVSSVSFDKMSYMFRRFSEVGQITAVWTCDVSEVEPIL